MRAKGSKRYVSYAGLLLALMAGVATAGSTNTLQWSWANPLPGPDYFNQIAFDGSTYVIAGNDGALYTSNDGFSWTPEATVIGRGGPPASLIYGGGHFILAGGDGEGTNHLLSSTDGNRWTAATIKGWTSDGTHTRLYYANNTYFLVDLDVAPLGTYFSSTDAVHWTAHTESFSIDQMIAANGVLLAWGNQTDGQTNGPDVLEYSKDDGTTWSEVTSFAHTPVIPAFYTDGHTLFLTDSDERTNGIYSSSDGVNWTKRTSTYIGPSFADPVLWNGSKFLTIADDLGVAYLYSSADGVTWSKGPANNLQEFTPSVVMSGSEYVAVGPGLLQVVRSSDFASWTSVFSGATGPDISFLDMVPGNGQYVAVGYIAGPAGIRPPAGIAESSDGLHWSGVYSGTAEGLNSVAYGNGRYVAASDSGSWVSSSDGVNWSAVAKPPATESSQVVFGNGVFTAFVGCATRCEVATSPDGQAWTTRALPSGMAPLGASPNLGRLGNRFVTLVPGADASIVYTSDDGLNWEEGSSITALAGYDFSHLREVAGSLVAMGTNDQSCGDQSECAGIPAVAVTHDALNWSIADSTAVALEDVTGDAQGYYATNLFGSPVMMESQDGLHWCPMTGIPTLFRGTALAMNGSQIVVTGGSSGAIIATPPPSAGTTNPPITCETEAQFQASQPPPPKTGSSGGRGDMGESALILLALSLLLRNRRGGGARRPA